MMNKLSAAAAAGAIALLGAGCGSSAGSGSDTTDNAAHAQAVRFAECMRAHDVPHFPDPDARNQFDFGIDVSGVVWTKALDACRAWRPPGSFSGKRTTSEQTTVLRFASCMRTHGVKDFPDPVNGDPIVDTTKIPSSNRPGGMAILNAAMKACGRIIQSVLARHP